MTLVRAQESAMRLVPPLREGAGAALGAMGDAAPMRVDEPPGVDAGHA